MTARLTVVTSGPTDDSKRPIIASTWAKLQQAALSSEHAAQSPCIRTRWRGLLLYSLVAGVFAIGSTQSLVVLADFALGRTEVIGPMSQILLVVMIAGLAGCFADPVIMRLRRVLPSRRRVYLRVLEP